MTAQAGVAVAGPAGSTVYSAAGRAERGAEYSAGQGYRFVHPRLSGALADLAIADASGNGFGSHRILIKIGLGAYW